MSKRGKSAFEKVMWDSVERGLIPHPDTYTVEELNYLNPEVPRWFNEQHVAKRDKKNGRQVRS